MIQNYPTGGDGCTGHHFDGEWTPYLYRCVKDNSCSHRWVIQQQFLRECEHEGCTEKEAKWEEIGEVHVSPDDIVAMDHR